ncbi:TIGR03943 family putative permease subunit [Paenibacillus arenilitoris]|uniref:TIGR03943 family protein n=1 Tax=Paenibacillus arenilitoris TaxID=2772299 RepID=A0A927CPL8_9BACL|nr:TIGR03943 family protein [Paenibacillus arenilitoris]MBD2869946.1 TIGR03943 family protein [Paenibacillus arenilitoris]
MIRYFILFGFSFMFFMLHYTGEIRKYINMKYAYLSISAVVILGLLCIFEFIRASRRQIAEEKRQAEAGEGESGQCEHHAHGSDGNLHHHSDHHDHGHSHGHESRLKRFIGYFILAVPIATGLFLPAHALDSSFVKAKGFSFPGFDAAAADNPGAHQFLKPDSSVFYKPDDYEAVRDKELAEFVNRPAVLLTDRDYLAGMEAIYNSPEAFMGKEIGFNGFVYKGQQVDDTHYFVFRFGFIHCVADSGVFGMLVEFPKNTQLSDDEWVRVKGKLTWELYQPFKQTIPVLRASEWERLDEPEDPYVYRS